MNILKISLLSLALVLVFGAAAAQDENTEAVALDETVTAESLGVEEPTVLPDSPFYFFKNLGRTIQSTFTFNAVKKAELREKFANEKLLELKKVTEKTKNTQTIEKATENYRKEVENVQKAVEKIKETAEENNEVGKFLDKFIQQQTLQQRILQKLETQVATATLAKIQEARAEHLEKFGEVMNKLEENKEKIQERLETNLQKVEGSEFQNFKNLEILDALEEKAPQAIKEAIQGATMNVMTQLKNEVREMTAEKLEQFQAYTENVSGVKEKQVEILENLKTELKSSPQIIQNLNQARERIMEQVSEKVTEMNCPEIAKPSSTFCQNGRVIIKKDANGCVISFDCVVPAETNTIAPTTGACITLWNPVCGKDGKTYSNACFAKLAGVEYTDGACIQIKEQIKRLAPESITPSTKSTQ